jgi:hypothetical protein
VERTGSTVRSTLELFLVAEKLTKGLVIVRMTR